MKKQLLPILASTLISLAGCNSSPLKKSFEESIYIAGEYQHQESYDLDLKVLAPTGAPAVGLYGFTSKLNDKFTTSSNPTNGVIPMFQSKEYDVIVAPTDSGLNQIMNLGAKFKIAATITFGNFYLVATGSDTDSELNSGDKVIIFQENGIPGKTFKYLYGDLGLITTAVPNAENTKQIIEANGLYDNVQYDYVLTAEPVVSATNSTAFASIQNDFDAKTGGKLMTQASVFVRNGINEEKIDNFLFVLKDSITAGLNNPDLIKTAIESVGSPEAQKGAFGVPGAIAKKVSISNGFNLGFKLASEIKDDIKEFVNLISSDVTIK